MYTVKTIEKYLKYPLPKVFILFLKFVFIRLRANVNLNGRREHNDRVKSWGKLTGNDRILEIVLAGTSFPDFRKVLQFSTAKLELAAQVCFLQDSLETSGELLLYVAAHVRRDHRHITFFRARIRGKHNSEYLPWRTSHSSFERRGEMF